MPKTLKITPHESVTVRTTSPELLEVEATYGPGGKPPPKHFHPRQDEEFEVIEGSLATKVDGGERELRAGDVLEVPRAAVHQMWNPGTRPAQVIWRTRPSGRTEAWFEAIDALHTSGRVGSSGMPNPLAYGALLTEYRDTFRLAGPDLLLRPALAGLALVARLRGYRPTD